jgi:hypothetical protein
MRLIQALSEGNPTSDSSAINRSGRRDIRVLNIVGAPALTAYEVDDADPTKSSVSGPLVSSSSADDIEDFLSRGGYNLDPNEWYPG